MKSNYHSYRIKHCLVWSQYSGQLSVKDLEIVSYTFYMALLADHEAGIRKRKRHVAKIFSSTLIAFR